MAISELSCPEIEVRIKGWGLFKVPVGTEAKTLLKQFKGQIKYPVVGVIINNNLRDLREVLDKSCQLEWVDTSSEIGVRIYTRSAAFLLIKAARDLFPDRSLIIKHSLSNGLFCEFIDGGTKPADVEQIKKRMREITAANLSIKQLVVSMEEARQIFTRQGQIDKVKLFEFRDKEHVHISELDGFYEYFYGYMVPETGMVDRFALLNYPPGLVLQTPELSSPGEIKPYIEQRKLAAIFKEAKAWAEMLETPHVAALNDIITSCDIGDIIRVNEALHEKKIASIADQICSDKRIR
ncbi:MAG: nucleoside kinase, partial [Syntrophomonas sp.]